MTKQISRDFWPETSEELARSLGYVISYDSHELLAPTDLETYSLVEPKTGNRWVKRVAGSNAVAAFLNNAVDGKTVHLGFAVAR